MLSGGLLYSGYIYLAKGLNRWEKMGGSGKIVITGESFLFEVVHAQY